MRPCDLEHELKIVEKMLRKFVVIFVSYFDVTDVNALLLP